MHNGLWGTIASLLIHRFDYPKIESEEVCWETMETLQIVFVVVRILICAVIFFLIGMFYRKKVAERDITSAEE